MTVERLSVWRADAEWDDDVEVVRAADYDLLAAEEARLRELVAEAERDAERYRLLRGNGRDPIAVRNHLSHLYDESLDAAVDALAAQEGS
ncbi:hypothetical protein K32_48890 [Kaistia sp. 32K]|uniref:hypothetical protein n=1 Tax=Kaistia sp. 32K TaxID=2795690 RepID=UPI00191573A5|nr:hypothetical protein [Kaistia sp. 32K]BCP56272.1 hypothetical protein K32_48890 [Kaistia sp. 32K]